MCIRPLLLKLKFWKKRALRQTDSKRTENRKAKELEVVKSVYRKINFLISQPKHMLWVRFF